MLASGHKAIWNVNVADNAPGTITQAGNRYLFSEQPTLTFTTQDVTKTYGDDLTGSIGRDYTSSGLRTETYGGAFVADAIGDFGTPEVTSDGAAANADVAGSPYTVSISGESMKSNGYKLVFNSTGRLTVEQAKYQSISGRKTYDGSAEFTGVTVTGIDVTAGAASMAME